MKTTFHNQPTLRQGAWPSCISQGVMRLADKVRPLSGTTTE